MGPIRKSTARSGGVARRSRGHKVPPATPRNKSPVKEEMNSLVEKGVYKGLKSEGVPKRKVRGPKKVRFVCPESVVP